MMGIFNNEPPKPKYDVMWATDISNLTFKYLTLKSVFLVAVKSQQRVQIIVSLSRQEYLQDREWCQFAAASHLKQSKPGRIVKTVTFFKYNDPDLCVVNTLIYYMKRTASLVHLKQPFHNSWKTLQKPFKGHFLSVDFRNFESCLYKHIKVQSAQH